LFSLKLLAYNQETVVAETFQAMANLGMANIRMKDFFDVWSLARTFAFDGQPLSGAIAATFQRRRTDLRTETPLALSEEFADDRTKPTQVGGFLAQRFARSRGLGPQGCLEPDCRFHFHFGPYRTSAKNLEEREGIALNAFTIPALRGRALQRRWISDSTASTSRIGGVGCATRCILFATRSLSAARAGFGALDRLTSAVI
jgi:hypothetical protein